MVNMTEPHYYELEHLCECGASKFKYKVSALRGLSGGFVDSPLGQCKNCGKGTVTPTPGSPYDIESVGLDQ